MNNFVKSFTQKKFRYGAFSTLTAIVVIAILIVINLVFSNLDIKYDLTSDKRYGISDRTVEVLNSLEEDITIYTLFKTGNDADSIVKQIMEILDQYEKTTARIKVENKDPYVYKTFVDQFSTDGNAVSENSIIVTSDRRSKIIGPNELVTNSYDNYGQVTSSNLNAESKTTNAIVYVTQENTYTVYALTGHNETALSSRITSMLTESNYIYDTLNLLQQDVPENCNALIITTPQKDISTDEAAKILKYLQGGGRALVALDIVNYPLTNLYSVLEAYGASFGDSYIFEGDSSYFIPGYNRYILPEQRDHAITSYLTSNGIPNLIVDACAIGISDVKKASITVDPLLSTSGQSFAKNDPESQSINKEAGDVDGPFNVAVALTDQYFAASDTITTKLVLVGSTSFLNESIDSVVYGANSLFLLDAVNWMTDKSEADSVYVPAKSLGDTEYLTIDQGSANLVFVFAVVLLPGAIIAAGLFVWLRRRNK